VVGGFASSTAVTLSFSGRSRELQAQTGPHDGGLGATLLATGVLLATNMTLVLLLVYLSVVKPSLVAPLLPPLPASLPLRCSVLGSSIGAAACRLHSCQRLKTPPVSAPL
jgi:uncharacterized membrane protein (DUF4010 family)